MYLVQPGQHAVPLPEFVMYLKVVPAVQQLARQMHL
jgi:hypothetical protein